MHSVVHTALYCAARIQVLNIKVLHNLIYNDIQIKVSVLIKTKVQVLSFGF